jgi:peptidoglycan/xylan/chitin deacetylase (PgdA/CDA1 family)
MARGLYRRTLASTALLMTAAGLTAALATAAPPHNRPVPILMYHVIAAAPAGVAYPDLFVPADDFAREMTWLASHEYHAVTERQVYDYWRDGRALPRRPIVVSFDDGYLSVHTQALPVLKRLRWPGVMNLLVRNVHSPYKLPVWRVRELIAAGWEIDAHTITHPDLTKVDDKQLWREVRGSRTALRSLFHVPVDFFCYPSGRYDARVMAAVRRAGYAGATTTNYGLASPANPYALSRVRIDGSDGIRGFIHKLEGLPPSPY